MAFAAVVVLTMLAAETFDPRLLDTLRNNLGIFQPMRLNMNLPKPMVTPFKNSPRVVNTAGCPRHCALAGD